MQTQDMLPEADNFALDCTGRPDNSGNKRPPRSPRGALGYPRPPTLPQNSIGSLRGDIRPDLCQSGSKFKTCFVLGDFCRTVRVDPTTLGTNDHHGHLEGPLAIQGRRPCLKIPSGASVATSDPTCANRVCPPFHSGLFGAIRVCSMENSPNPTHQRSNPTLEGTIPHLGTRYDHSRLKGARTFTLLLCLWSFKGF
ncbi:hypothetical protein CRG98_011995 [Punica granatum]|uniref:Uncharacterized protein n=1 Tax=Punica granatum TaxID=22663 RepID=A0A2I0KGI9_PUNGR|nr:hypothetical protein CRG98_011995 [Punica granatum]